jgi:hypothetical protein
MFAPIAAIVALLGSAVGARGKQVLMLGVGRTSALCPGMWAWALDHCWMTGSAGELACEDACQQLREHRGSEPADRVRDPKPVGDAGETSADRVTLKP